MIKLGQLNSRMKDFYDIQVVLRQFGFDGEVLCLAIERTFANRGTMIDSEPFVFSPQFLENSIKQAQWTAFVRKLKLDGTPDSFADVVREIQAFFTISPSSFFKANLHVEMGFGRPMVISSFVIIRPSDTSDQGSPAEDPRKIDSTWHIPPGWKKCKLTTNQLTRVMVAVWKKMGAENRMGKQQR